MTLSGMITLELHGEKIYFKLPEYFFTGLLTNKRTLSLKETLTVVDPNSNLRAVVSFGEKKMAHKVDGFIINLPDDFDLDSFVNENKTKCLNDRKCLSKEINKDIRKHCRKFTVKDFTKAKQKKKLNGLDLLGVFSGSWVTEFFIDEEKFWDVSVERYSAQVVKDPLPSDSRFRNDLLWFLSGDLNMAQLWKYHYESVHRQERKKRQKLNSGRMKK